MLKLNELTVIYHGIKALNTLTACAYQDDFITIVGHNGAGKSTLIKTIEGRIALNNGSIILDNQDITNQTQLQRATLVSTLHQNTTLGSVGNMTVEENMALSLYKGRKTTLTSGFKPLQNHPTLLADWQKLFPHKNVLQEKVEYLSGGERQMLAFLMATAVPPKLLLLDEPTAALDPIAADRMMNFISAFVKSNRIITIMVTHDLDTALTQGNKIWVIKNGAIAHEIDTQIRKLTATELKALL